MNRDTDNEIIHRWRGGQSMRSIAREMNVSRWRVARVIQQHQASRDDPSAGPDNSQLPAPASHYSSKLDAFEARIGQLLERYPNITVTRILEELRKEGYTGGYTILRERVKKLRREPKKPLVVRFETAPGVQAQMDWSVYDIDFSGEGRRRVNLFSYLLGYSRRQYLCFTERQDFEATTGQHIHAFRNLGGLATGGRSSARSRDRNGALCLRPPHPATGTASSTGGTNGSALRRCETSSTEKPPPPTGATAAAIQPAGGSGQSILGRAAEEAALRQTPGRARAGSPQCLSPRRRRCSAGTCGSVSRLLLILLATDSGNAGDSQTIVAAH